MKACQMFDRAWVQARIGVAASLMLGAATSGAVDWTGGGDGTNWNDGANWDGGSVPSAVSAVLGDVASGSRTVSVNAAVPAITLLSMAQTTVGAVNALQLGTVGADLSINGTNPFSLNPAAGADSLRLNLSGGHILVYPGAADASAALSSTISFSNNSRIRILESPGIAQNISILGKVSSDQSDGDAPGFFVLNSPAQFNFGSSDNDAVELHINSGRFAVGRLASNSSNRNQTLNNWGAAHVANDGELVVLTNRDWENATYNNQAGSVLVLGSADVLGQAKLLKIRGGSQGGSGSQPGAFNVANHGTARLYGSSVIVLFNTTESNSTFSNTGAVEFFADKSVPAGYYATATGTYAAGTQNINNTGTITAGKHATLAAPDVGLVRFGIAQTTNRQGENMNFNNNSGGSVLIDPRMTFDFAHSSSAADATRNLNFNNAQGGSVTVGVGAADSAEGGTLLMRFHRVGTGATRGITFNNSGTLALLGTSVLENPSDGATIGDATFDSKKSEWFFNNTASGVLALNHASRIGNATHPVTTFSNDGTLRKTGASGTATIYGDVAFTSDATYEVATGGTASAPLLHVEGTVDLGGSTLAFVDAPTSAMTLLTHSGARTGVFGAVENAPGYVLVYDANAARLIMPATVLMIR